MLESPVAPRGAGKDTARPRASARRRPRPLLTAGWLVLGPLVALAAIELGGLAAVTSAASDARAARDAGDDAGAVAAYRAVASRGGPVFLLARGRIDEARLDADRTLLDWAGRLAAAGRIEQAVDIAGRVSDPRLTVEASRRRATIALDAARAQAAAGHPDAALAMLDLVRSGTPPPDLAAQERSLRPGYALAAAQALLDAGRSQDAVAALDGVVAVDADPQQTARATALLPRALLEAGHAALDARSVSLALDDLTRLADRFAATPEADAARVLLSSPQRVIGTLVHRDGSPVSGVRVRLGSNFRHAGTGFLTGPPYVATRTDGTGAFRFEAVPVGAPFVLEYIDQGEWTVLETQDADPARRHPVYTVSVAPLSPVDLALVRIP